jgi:hypothetical protein
MTHRLTTAISLDERKEKYATSLNSGSSSRVPSGTMIDLEVTQGGNPIRRGGRGGRERVGLDEIGLQARYPGFFEVELPMVSVDVSLLARGRGRVTRGQCGAGKVIMLLLKTGIVVGWDFGDEWRAATIL